MTTTTAKKDKSLIETIDSLSWPQIIFYMFLIGWTSSIMARPTNVAKSYDMAVLKAQVTRLENDVKVLRDDNMLLIKGMKILLTEIDKKDSLQ